MCCSTHLTSVLVNKSFEIVLIFVFRSFSFVKSQLLFSDRLISYNGCHRCDGDFYNGGEWCSGGRGIAKGATERRLNI